MGHRRRSAPRFILQVAAKQCSVNSENELFSGCVVVHAETKHDEQDQTLRQIFHQHKTSVKVQRHSSSSSTFALRPAPAAKSKAIFFFFNTQNAIESKQTEEQHCWVCFWRTKFYLYDRYCMILYNLYLTWKNVNNYAKNIFIFIVLRVPH